MTELLTTYRAKGLTIGLVFLFKYDLNGNLREFQIVEGQLNESQIKWLFSSRFPLFENTIKTFWMKSPDYKKHFEVTASPAKLDFETLWNLYDNKVKRVESEKQFKKLKEADLIKLFISVPRYKEYLQRKRIAQAHLSTFINQRYFEDDWSKA